MDTVITSPKCAVISYILRKHYQETKKKIEIEEILSVSICLSSLSIIVEKPRSVCCLFCFIRKSNIIFFVISLKITLKMSNNQKPLEKDSIN